MREFIYFVFKIWLSEGIKSTSVQIRETVQKRLCVKANARRHLGVLTGCAFESVASMLLHRSWDLHLP